MLRTRLATAAVAIPTLVWLILASPAWVFSGFILAMTAVGLGEFAAMALPGHRLGQALCILAGLAFACAVIVRGPDSLGLVLLLVLGLGMILSLADPDMPGAASRLANGIFAALYGGFLLPHVVSLRLLPGGERWVFFTIACAMGADTGGYFAGRFRGRHKLFPRVSPNKTVEGAVGALLGAVLAAVFVMKVLQPTGLGLRSAGFLGLLVAILAQLGDLVESMLKRAYGTKDSGWIIPGHGGVLDRTDSLVLPLVFAYYLRAGLDLWT